MRYFIQTYGCQMNESDSERIMAVLDSLGHKKAVKMEEADYVIINLCSVRETAVSRVFGQFSATSKLNKDKKKQKIFLTGCILAPDKKRLEGRVDLIFDIREIDKLKEFLLKDNIDWRKNLKTNSRDRDKELNISYLKINPKYDNKVSAFVPIMTGCNNFCSYCVVPYTRGEEISRSVNSIVKEVKELIKNNYQEIILLGQNVNSYKFIESDGTKIDFGQLLKIINDLKGGFKISFISNHPKDMSMSLIKAIASCDKVIKHLHLPFQAGDDEILKNMNRGYTQQDYLDLIDKIKKEIPDIKLSTDVIVGFPGETKKQFNETVKVLKKVKFENVYTNKYSTRKGTLASKKFVDDIPLVEKKIRWKIIDDLVNKKDAKRK